MTDIVPATVMVTDQDGKKGLLPLGAYNPEQHNLSRACKTVEVRDKAARKDAESYVINASDFDPKRHVKAEAVEERVASANPDE
jgi:hypothetical protein